jgi:hypothetical protein
MIIGITGRKRSGKDTIAQYLTRQWGFKKYALAEPIRICCRIIFGWSENWIEHHKEEIDAFWGISYRKAAQLIGTDLFRKTLPEIDPVFRIVTGDEIWINRMRKMCDLDTNWVVPDVRFQNEASAIRELGGLVLRVERDDEEWDDHPSETSTDSIQADGVVWNDGTKDWLFGQVETLMQAWMKEDTHAGHQ